MLENLINLVRESAGDAIINNPAIPNDRNEEAVQDTSHSIVNSLKNALSGGNVNDVMKIFSGRTDPSNPVVQDATNNLTQNLSGKYGIDRGQASGIAGGLIPIILSQLAGKTSDPSNNGFNIQDIFNQLTGGKTSGVNPIVHERTKPLWEAYKGRSGTRRAFRMTTRDPARRTTT